MTRPIPGRPFDNRFYLNVLSAQQPHNPSTVTDVAFDTGFKRGALEAGHVFAEWFEEGPSDQDLLDIYNSTFKTVWNSESDEHEADLAAIRAVRERIKEG